MCSVCYELLIERGNWGCGIVICSSVQKLAGNFNAGRGCKENTCRCVDCQNWIVQSSKPNRSFSKNCPELTGKPSKIKFF
jgi:hypothetical protein